jgi:hypothetical protein
MAVIITNGDHDKLLTAIKMAIDTDKIKTWTYDNDGDFTHTASQWIKKAWFRPRNSEGTDVIFSMIGTKNMKITKTIYGVYHGRFIEMLLTHFDDMFTNVRATALPDNTDNI